MGEILCARNDFVAAEPYLKKSLSTKPEYIPHVHALLGKVYARTDRTGCFELADGGTLFLDEIANMPLGQQAKLLRVLQTGEYHPVGSSRVRRADVRFLAGAIHAALEDVAPTVP